MRTVVRWLPLRVRVASHFADRARGLIGSTLDSEQDALLLRPCRAIHTAGMTTPIDVVFLARDHRIVALREHVHPWRFAACWRARSVLELRAGAIRRWDLHAGEVLRWQPG